MVRAKFPKLEYSGRCHSCGKKYCLVCDSISTTTKFTAKVCQKTFKIQKGSLNRGSKKVLHLLKCKACGKFTHVARENNKFCYNFNNYKCKHRAFVRNISMVIIVSMTTVALMIEILWFLKDEERIGSWKKSKLFGNIDLKRFTWLV